MPKKIRAKMERAFGQDFSKVRIHEGPQAESIGALAFTQGHDIHFKPGQYKPQSQEGQKILGHELTHVVQQRAGRVAMPAGKGPPINADPTLEVEANALGAKAARGQLIAPAKSSNARASKPVAGASTPPIQRLPDWMTHRKEVSKRLRRGVPLAAGLGALAFGGGALGASSALAKGLLWGGGATSALGGLGFSFFTKDKAATGGAGSLATGPLATPMLTAAAPTGGPTTGAPPPVGALPPGGPPTGAPPTATPIVAPPPATGASSQTWGDYAKSWVSKDAWAQWWNKPWSFQQQ